MQSLAAIGLPPPSPLEEISKAARLRTAKRNIIDIVEADGLWKHFGNLAWSVGPPRGPPWWPDPPWATRLLTELQVSMGQPLLMKVLLHDTALGIQGKGRKRRQLQAKLTAQLRPKPNISHIVDLCLERMSTWWHAPAADYDMGGRITELFRAAAKGSPYTPWVLPARFRIVGKRVAAARHGFLASLGALPPQRCATISPAPGFWRLSSGRLWPPLTTRSPWLRSWGSRRSLTVHRLPMGPHPSQTLQIQLGWSR